MSQLNIEIPESMQRQVEELAAQEGISADQFIALAVAEKMASLRTLDYLRQRGQHGSAEKFAAVLSRVRPIEPEERDRLS
jgi:hypothetical protein